VIGVESLPGCVACQHQIKHDCEFLYQLNPLPEWGKSWRDFERDGDRNDALYPIGNGVKQAIERPRQRSLTPE
jgi:hypothetical protein